MRIAAVWLLSMLLTLVMMPAAAADQHMDEDRGIVEVIMEIGETTYTVDGESHTIDAGPYIENGRTMVPLRFLAEAFGLAADWGPKGDSTRWVTFAREALLIELEIGSTEIEVTEDGVTRTEVSDVAAQIRNDRTYLPLRSVGEIFGAEFDWGPREASTEWVSFSYSAARPVEPGPVQSIRVEMIADGFTAPLALVSAQDGTGRLFVADQAGLIRIVHTEGNLPTANFLDLRDKIVELNPNFDERGLLGLAFHPQYEQNGRFFVHYSSPLREGAPADWNHTAVIAEYSVSENNPHAADPLSGKILLEIDQPQFNHNGGQIAFGPDGYLYIPLGDGGGSNDVGLGHPAIGNGQDRSTLLGSILRIDVDQGPPYAIPADNPLVGAAGRDEIFAYGFRNPYRISFDSGGINALFAADVGQNLWEEINIVTRGGNYGWNIKEGTHCFDPENPNQPLATCANVGALGEPLLDPILEYRNARHGGIGIAVIGGYVYRGDTLPGLLGVYIFADWSLSFGQGDGTIFAASSDNGVWDFRELTIENRENQRMGLFITGMGQDGENELYILTTENSGPAGNTGKVFKIVAAGS